MLNPEDLQTYLHTQIPLAKTMGIEVVRAGTEGVVLAAPLAPNINPHKTVFGGSVSAVAMLSAWSLVHYRLNRPERDCSIVLQRNSVSYLRPVTGNFTASSVLHDSSSWAAFLDALTRKGRARIRVLATVLCDGQKAAEFEGDFVAQAAARN